MATNVQGRPAREHPLQLVHYLRKEIAFDTPDIAAGVPFNTWLPAGAEILFTMVKIKAAFNAGTTNVLTVGTNATDYNNLVAAAGVDETELGATSVPTGAALTFSEDARPFVKFTQTGTAASAGQAVIIIAYVPNNDE